MRRMPRVRRRGSNPTRAMAGEQRTRQAKTSAAAPRRASPQARPSSSALRPARNTCACGGGCPRCSPASSESAAELSADRAARSALAADAPASPPSLSVAPTPPPADVRGPGRALTSGQQQHFGPRLGADLSNVRLHVGADANRAARAERARAFAYGSHVVFGEGAFAPATPAGRYVLAHELAHTVQQVGGPPTVQRLRVPTSDEVWNAGVSLGEDLVDTGAALVDRAGDALGEAASDVGAFFVDVIAGYAPELVEFLQNDPLETIKTRLWATLDAWLGGFLTNVRDQGLFGALNETFGGVPDRIATIVEELRAGECGSLFEALREIAAFGSELIGPGWETLQEVLTDVNGALSEAYDTFIAPHVDDIVREGGLWDELTEWANDTWEDLAPARQYASDAWNWFRDAFDIVWDSGVGLIEWFQGLITEAWEALKEELGPWAYVLAAVITGVSMLTPLGPIVLAVFGLPALWDGLTEIRENWDDLEVVIAARELLHETVLPAINSGLLMLDAALAGATVWLQSTVAQLSSSIRALAEQLGLTPYLDLLSTFVDSLAEEAASFAEWVSTTMTEVFDAVREAGREAYAKTRPLFGLVAALVLFPVYPFLLPIVLTGWAWRLAPDCVKLPIVDWAIGLMLDAVRALSEHPMFGAAWPQAKVEILELLEHVREEPEEQRIAHADRIAKMMTLEDVEWIGNLVRAVVGAPEEFFPQVVEELTGMRIDEQLPFERPLSPQASAVASTVLGADLTDFEQRLADGGLRDGEVVVDQVAELDLPPELLASLEDGVTFGERPDELAAPETVAAELGLLGLPPVGEEGEGGEDLSQLSHEELTERQLQEMMAQPVAEQTAEGRPICTESTDASAAQQQEVPPELQIGPLTRGQRARYLLNRMGLGIAHWFDCNKHWLIPALIVAAVGLIAVEILTEGAITAALPVIGEVLTVLFIGIAAIRSAFYLARFMPRAVTGDVRGGSQDLARAVAVAAVEIVFALLFNIGAVIKTARSAVTGVTQLARQGFRGTTRALTNAASRGVTAARGAIEGSIDSFRTLGRIGRAGFRTGVGNLRRIPGAILEEGRLVMDGLRGGFGSGVRTLQELAERLWRRVRFRRFRMTRFGGRWQLWGEFNPWVLLADGRVVHVEHAELPPGAVAGDFVEVLLDRRRRALVVEPDDLHLEHVVRRGAGDAPTFPNAPGVEVRPHADLTTPTMQAVVANPNFLRDAQLFGRGPISGIDVANELRRLAQLDERIAALSGRRLKAPDARRLRDLMRERAPVRFNTTPEFADALPRTQLVGGTTMVAQDSLAQLRYAQDWMNRLNKAGGTLGDQSLAYAIIAEQAAGGAIARPVIGSTLHAVEGIDAALRLRRIAAAGVLPDDAARMILAEAAKLEEAVQWARNYNGGPLSDLPRWASPFSDDLGRLVREQGRRAATAEEITRHTAWN
ncbi:MAG: DUF4157 domain-containing protein [Deltaproteobacteria bacterium]